MRPPSTAERVRARLREELKARDISQRELAEALTKQTGEFWSQPKVAKVLGGHVELKVDDADAIAKIAGIFLTEAVRDRGLEFYAEMTPTELRVLEQLRREPEIFEGVRMILRVRAGGVGAKLTRPPKPKRGRPLNSSLQKPSA